MIDWNEAITDILIAIVVIAFLLTICFGISKGEEQEKINELEEKLNIYRESYEEFCLEDSLSQQEEINV